MADAVDDCEGALLAAARGIVGPHVAVGVLLDLHANVTSAMCAMADLTVSCREYPHIDYGERAAEMLPVLRNIADGHHAASHSHPTDPRVRCVPDTG